MKKLFFLLIILVFTLSACGETPATTAPTTAPTTEPTTEPTTQPTEPDPRAPLLKSWKYPTTVDGNLMALPDFDGTVEYPVVWLFQADGTTAIMEDREAYLTAIGDFEEKLIDFLVDSRYNLFVSESKYQGRDEAWIETEWNTNGREAQVRQEMTDSVTALQLATRCAPNRFLGSFTMDGSIISVADSEGILYDFTFSVSDEALIMTPVEGNTLLEDLELPQPLILLP